MQVYKCDICGKVIDGEEGTKRNVAFAIVIRPHDGYRFQSGTNVYWSKIDMDICYHCLDGIAKTLHLPMVVDENCQPLDN